MSAIDERSRVVFEFGQYKLNPAERILLRDGEPVALTPKAFETLLVLVENAGHVLEKDELMRRVWPDSFVEEATLAQNVFTLRKTLGESPTEHPYIETVPRRGYRFVARVATISEQPDSNDAQSIDEATAVTRSIAVLPFKILRPGSGDEYFGLGMADALITKLSNINRIIVRPTSAIIRYGRPEQESIAAGRELKVDLVLEGKMQRLDERIRVTVQLLNVNTAAPLWAEKFDDEFRDIFSVQDTISSQVIEALTLKLTRGEKKLLNNHPTKNSMAYQEYLKGRYQWNKWTEEGFQKSIQHFARAIELEPDYALAFSGIADAYNALAFYSCISPHKAMPQIKIAARRAIALDDTLAEAHLSLGTALMFYEWNWPAAEEEFLKAIELRASHAMSHQAYGLYLVAMGRFGEAETQFARAVALDPVSPLISTTSGFPFYFSGRYDQAVEIYRAAIDANPEFGLAHTALGDAYMQLGKIDAGIEHYLRAIELLGRKENVLASLGYAYAQKGNRPAANKLIEELQTGTAYSYVSPLALATIYTGLGQTTEAFEWLETAYQDRATRLVYLKVHPVFAPLRSDQRFINLLRSLRLIAPA